MPLIRELVIDGEIIKSIPKAIAKYGGTARQLKWALLFGEHMYMGHRVEYLREKPHAITPAPQSALDRRIAEISASRPKKARRARLPLLASKHFTTFGIYRDQLIYR